MIPHTHTLPPHSYWARLIPDAAPGVQARCIENVELYLVAVHEQARHRDTGEVPTTQEYIELRRLSSGCKPLFDLLEYSLDMQLPDYIIEDPLMETLKNCCNDFVAFNNVSSNRLVQCDAVVHC